MRPLMLLLFVVPAILHAYPQQADRRVSSSRKYGTVLAKLIVIGKEFYANKGL
jgi:hypothetical protein